jgi:hypothetical protein
MFCVETKYPQNKTRSYTWQILAYKFVCMNLGVRIVWCECYEHHDRNERWFKSESVGGLFPAEGADTATWMRNCAGSMVKKNLLNVVFLSY